MSAKLYILEYHPDENGCPVHIAQEYEPEEWEWENQDPNPFQVQIARQYSSVIIDGDIRFVDFDFYGLDSRLVSSRFIDVCKTCAVRFRSVPFDIRFSDYSRPEKQYFIFLPADHLPILDAERSVCEVELNVETGMPMMDRFFPDIPIYQKIEKFVVRDFTFPALFQSVELDMLVCTDEFHQHAMNSGLRGLKFVPLDENYVYDPWAGW